MRTHAGQLAESIVTGASLIALLGFIACLCIATGAKAEDGTVEATTAGNLGMAALVAVLLAGLAWITARPLMSKSRTDEFCDDSRPAGVNHEELSQ